MLDSTETKTTTPKAKARAKPKAKVKAAGKEAAKKWSRPSVFERAHEEGRKAAFRALGHLGPEMSRAAHHCSICEQEGEEGEEFMFLTCAHKFHK